MPRGIPNAKPIIEAPEPVASEPAIKMVAMKLLRHYRPVGAYEVVGYLKTAIERKQSDGTVKVIEPEEYIPGQQAPAPFPGVVSTGKVWANTTILVPEDEGKTMRRLGIAERDFED
jgi:hypothetical protein